MCPNLFIVDDEPEICEILSDLLSEEFDSRWESNAKTALELLPEIRPALVIFDLGLNEMRGVDFLTQALAIAPNTRFVLCTGSSPTSPDVAAALKAGAVGAIYKPFPARDTLIATLKGWL